MRRQSDTDNAPRLFLRNIAVTPALPAPEIPCAPNLFALASPLYVRSAAQLTWAFDTYAIAARGMRLGGFRRTWQLVRDIEVVRADFKLAATGVVDLAFPYRGVR